MFTIVFLFLFFIFYFLTKSESECLFLNRRNCSESLLFGWRGWNKCICSYWDRLNNRLSCNFFSSPFLTSGLHWSFFLFLSINLFSCPSLFRLVINFYFCLWFGFSFSFFAEFNESSFLFNWGNRCRSRSCTSNSTHSLESPFGSHFTLIFSHFSFLLFFFLFILFSQCFSTGNNFFFIIIWQSLFEVSHLLIISLL